MPVVEQQEGPSHLSFPLSQHRQPAGFRSRRSPFTLLPPGSSPRERALPAGRARLGFWLAAPCLPASSPLDHGGNKFVVYLLFSSHDGFSVGPWASALGASTP